MGEVVVVWPPVGDPPDPCGCYSGWQWIGCETGYVQPCRISKKHQMQQQHHLLNFHHPTTASGTALIAALAVGVAVRKLRKLF